MKTAKRIPSLFAIALTLTSLMYSSLLLEAAEVPILVWTNRYNGTGNNTDVAQAVAVDASNRVVVTGYSLGSGSFDYATVQYSGTGVPLWTNRYDGPGNAADTAKAVAVDGSNDVIVTGYSGIGTNNDYVTIKYSPSGVPLWTNRYSSSVGGNDQAFALAVDQSNQVVVTGSSGGDYATIKYSTAGVALWTNRYNGPANNFDIPVAIGVDSSNNVIVTGRSLAGGVGSDYLTIKYSGAGVPLWTNRYNGLANNIDEPSALVVDASNNIIVTGRSVTDLYSFGTVKYSSPGVPLWTNYFRDPTGTTAYANALAVDRNGNIFVTGYWFAGLYENLATVAYSSAGVPLWTNSYNGPANNTDIGRVVIVDDNNNVMVSGHSGGEIATIKYSNAGFPLWTNRYGPGAPWATAMDVNGDVIVTGQENGGASGFDYVTIKLLSPPVLAAGIVTNETYQLQLRRPNAVVMEFSTNLVNWVPVFTNYTSTNLLLFNDASFKSYFRRFFRAVRVP
jgi:hypothetical protein